MAGPGPLCLYLLFLNPVLNLFGGRLVRSEQVDGAGELWVQYVSIFVSDHQIEIQVPSIKTGGELMSGGARQDENIQSHTH